MGRVVLAKRMRRAAKCLQHSHLLSSTMSTTIQPSRVGSVSCVVSNSSRLHCTCVICPPVFCTTCAAFNSTFVPDFLLRFITIRKEKLGNALTPSCMVAREATESYTCGRTSSPSASPVTAPLQLQLLQCHMALRRGAQQFKCSWHQNLCLLMVTFHDPVAGNGTITTLASEIIDLWLPA